MTCKCGKGSVDLLGAVTQYAEGMIAVHKTNVEVYMANPAGIGEHSDVTEAVIGELKRIAEYDDVIEVIEKYW
jgi:hypothetical protein